MERDLLIGIDIGTSACKAAAFRADGTAIASATAEYPVYYPHAGWAEQDAEEWWQGACAAVRDLLAQGIRAESIAAVGIDGQSWATVPVRGEKAIARTPIWMDMRSGDLCGDLEERLGKERLFACSGNPLQPGYCTPKYLWMRREMPEVLEKADKLLSSNAFIAWKLTGEHSLDLSQGYGWSCFDMRKGAYDFDLMREIGIDARLMPELRAPHDVIGTISAKAAGECGLCEGTPVVCGGLDAACATLGAGVYLPGQTQEQGGQAGGMSICTDVCTPDPALITGFHVVPGMWLLQGGTVGGGVMRWMREALGCEDFRRMDEEAASAKPGCSGVTLLPYFSGERSPIWDSDAKAVYYGIRYSTTRAELLRAGLESSAYALRHNLDVAEKAGAKVGAMSATGGAAQSRLWTQIKADITGKRILVPDAEKATVMGAAMLAGVGCGLYASFADAVGQTVRILRTHEPSDVDRPAYDTAYARYLGLYTSLCDFMKQY